jgi:hypothetical protein
MVFWYPSIPLDWKWLPSQLLWEIIKPSPSYLHILWVCRWALYIIVRPQVTKLQGKTSNTTNNIGNLKRQFFHFSSNTASQHRRSAQALLTFASPPPYIYSGCSVTLLPPLPVTNHDLFTIRLCSVKNELSWVEYRLLFNSTQGKIRLI